MTLFNLFPQTTSFELEECTCTGCRGCDCCTGSCEGVGKASAEEPI